LRTPSAAITPRHAACGETGSRKARPFPVVKLALSFREAAKALGIDRNRLLRSLIREGKLRTIPWGKRTRIPLAEVERLAREGFSLGSRAKPRAQRGRPARQDPEALRKLDLTKL